MAGKTLLSGRVPRVVLVLVVSMLSGIVEKLRVPMCAFKDESITIDQIFISTLLSTMNAVRTCFCVSSFNSSIHFWSSPGEIGRR